MVFGFSARQFNPYEQEVEFARANGFDFLQVWYDRNGILNKDIQEQVERMKQSAFPAIFHALLDLNDMEEHVPKLIHILKLLGHTEVIIHPVYKSEVITDASIYKLDPIHTTTREIQIMFEENPALELLPDVAHMDNYKHLQEMVLVKMPKILHAADRHLEAVHEHLPIGYGNIDFENVFEKILHTFDEEAGK